MTTIATIDLPSWGNVFVCRLPDDVRLAFAECLGNLKSKRRKLEVRAKLIARAVIDESLKRVFTDDDWEGLAQLPEAQLAHVYKIACEVNELK